jgi:hypothetical protein
MVTLSESVPAESVAQLKKWFALFVSRPRKDLDDLNWMTNRVTRLGDFSHIGRLFTQCAVFYHKHNSQHFWATFFHDNVYV